MSATRPTALKPGWILIELAGVWFAWWAFAASVLRGRAAFAYDSIRDVAYAHGILRGEWWQDPMIAGLPAWYPPGMPALFALFSRVSGLPVAELYATSAPWFNALNPLLLYLLVRATWGRTAAALSLPLVLLGSRWWTLHALHPMASIQTVFVLLGTLLAWRSAAEQGGRWLVVTVALAALTLWCHVLCGLLVIGTIGLHAAIGSTRALRMASNEGRALARRGAAVLAGALVLSAPVLLQQLALPRVNDAPQHWFGPELLDPRFALHAGSPLVIVFGLVGLVTMLRRWHAEGWLVAYFALALVGSLFGYAAHEWQWPLPWATPHVFQWHEQLALMVAAAVGIVQSAQRISRSAAVRAVATIVFVVAAVGPVVPELKQADSYLTIPDPGWKPIVGSVQWLEANTPPHTVVATGPDAAYLICGLAGRRTVVMPDGHLNPAADHAQRLADVQSLMSTESESTFVAIARRYGVGYLLATNDLVPARLRAQYSRWRTLEPARTEDSTAILYRVTLP